MKPTRSSRYIGAYVPVNVVYPGVAADEKTLVQLLSTLNRNETVIVLSKGCTEAGWRAMFRACRVGAANAYG